MKKFGPFSRHLRRLILELVRSLKFFSILDVGCGQGELLKLISTEFPGITLTGLDFSSKAIDLARANVPDAEFYQLDLAHKRLDTQFDLVICSEVLEHIVDDVSAIENLAQMTRKYLLVTSPQGRMRKIEISEYGHVRNYRYGELRRKIESSGLTPRKIVEWGFPFYSPLYRDILNLIHSHGTTGQYGSGRKLLATLIYRIFFLNSSQRGDELLILAEKVS
jgi:SAM-dependent methyltransferase